MGYAGCSWALIRAFDAISVMNVKDQIQGELSERFSVTDENCVDAVLGGPLKFYGFPDDYVKQVTNQAKERFKHVHEGLKE